MSRCCVDMSLFPCPTWMSYWLDLGRPLLRLPASAKPPRPCLLLSGLTASHPGPLGEAPAPSGITIMKTIVQISDFRENTGPSRTEEHDHAKYVGLKFPTSELLCGSVDDASPPTVTATFFCRYRGAWADVIHHTHNSAALHTFTIHKQSLRADQWQQNVELQWLKLLCGSLINKESCCSTLTHQAAKI